MHIPGQNRAQLPQYRSQVAILPTNKSPVLIGPSRHQFKQSAVNDYSKKYLELEKKPHNYNLTRKHQDLLSQRQQVKGYQHLLGAKGRQQIKSPINTYRSRQNLSPQTLRENIYVSDNESQLQQNRSAKFISKLRQEINSPKQKHHSPRVAKQPEVTRLKLKDKLEPSVTTEMRTNRLTETFVESRVNHTDYHGRQHTRQMKQLQEEERYYSPETVKKEHYEESEEAERADDSLQMESFEKKLLDKCKLLQLELDRSEQEVVRLSHKLQTAQSKHRSQMNLIRNDLMLQRSRKDSQLQMAKRQLEQVQKSYKQLQRTKTSKQKSLTQQISKYVKSLKQSQQQKNKLVLQFEAIVREKVSMTERKCSDQSIKDFQRITEENKQLKRELVQVKNQLQEVVQEKEDFFEESKLLHMELQNYTKWNDEQQHQNRLLQRKMHDTTSHNKLLLQQKDLLQSSIDQLEQTLTSYKSTIKSHQTTQYSLNEQLQIVKFELQSVKNELQGGEKEWMKERGSYVEEIEILEVKCGSAAREKAEMGEELDFQRKELANMRRLVDSIQDRLQEERRNSQQLEIMRDKYELEMKEKSSSLTKSLETIIYHESQLSQKAKLITELQQQLKLARVQKSYSHLQHNSTISEANESEPSRVSDYLEHVQQLEKQISELVSNFKQQKTKLTKDHELKQQETKKKLTHAQNDLIHAQNDLFRKQETALDDRKRHTLQLAKHQEHITKLQDELTEKKTQLKHTNDQLNVKDVQIKHLSLKLQELHHTSEQKLTSKDHQLTDVKNCLNIQRHNELSILLKIIDNIFAEFDNALGSSGVKALQERCDTHYEGQGQLHRSLVVQQKQQSPLKSRFSSLHKSRLSSLHQSQSPFPAKTINSTQSPPRKHSFLPYVKQFNPHELTMQLACKTKQLTSTIKLLTKKIHLYQTTIHSLENSLHSQPIQIHQKYIYTISELEKNIYIHETTSEMRQAQFSKTLKEQKDNLFREVEKMKLLVKEKEQEINELATQISRIKKTEEEFRDKMQLTQKDHKKLVKKLNSDIEEYKNLCAVSQTHQTHTSNNPSNLYSMTTIPEQSAYPLSNAYNHHEKTPVRAMKQPLNHRDQAPSQNNSLQQLLESRLNQLTQENKHLSNQLSSVNNQLIKEKQTFIELNALVRNLQHEIQKMDDENDHLTQNLDHLSQQHTQLTQELTFLQQHNHQLQNQLASQQHNYNLTLQKLQKTTHTLSQTQKSNQQMSRQLQTQHTQQAHKYVDFKKIQDQLTIKQSEIDLLRLQKEQQTAGGTKKCQELENKLKEQTDKRSTVQKIYHQLLQWIQQQPFASNHFSKPTSHPTQPSPLDHYVSNPSPLTEYHSQSISHLTITFTSQLSTLQHTIQELSHNNDSLKSQIHRHKSLLQEKQLEVHKRQRQLEITKDKVTALARTIQRLEIQIQEWKFICQSSTLNKSLTLQKKWIKDSFRDKNPSPHQSLSINPSPHDAFHKSQFAQSTFTNHHSPQSKPILNIQPNLYPEKGTSNTKPSQSPLKLPPKLIPYQQPQLSGRKLHQQTVHNRAKVDKPLLNSMESNLQNSIDSVLSVGQFYQIQKGRHFCNDSAQMSFF